MDSVVDMLDKETEVMGMKKKRNSVSCREYYSYKLQIRSLNDSMILHIGRLLQQFVVDMYVKLETSRLDYFRKNQTEIRAELYQGIMDSVDVGETRGIKVGRRIILPSTFIGGPRDMRRRYMDAMTLVQIFGKPDIFLTMTCNPNWIEIKQELIKNEEAQNRPDLVSRVFRAKLEELKKDLFKDEIFGPVAAHVHVIEFQKRGLPHAHILIILKSNSKENSFPLYRRRDDGCKVKVRGSVLDNRWVVPYNPYLLAKFDCHINVEICSTIKAVKYLYKYIYKGHDKVAMNIKSFKNDEDIDEIHSFQSARWISPPEAMGATSFDDLKCVNGVQCLSYRDAALLHGLLESDNSFELCLEEASLYQMPYSLRSDRVKRSKVLGHINIILESMGKTLADYDLLEFDIDDNDIHDDNREISEELSIVINDDDIASSSGVAASILPGGRTAHSRFKIPLVMEEHNTCHVSKQSGLAKLMKDASLIVWDEAPMVKKEAIESLDKMLQDINECDLLFGGKVVVFGGDFRQVLPVVPKDIHEDFLNMLVPNGFPPHELRLKVNCPVMLLRNINPSEGLCNGTRLICRRFDQNVIDAEISVGEYREKRVFLPRIPFMPIENVKDVLHFKRKQFPIRLCFAMTINKAQRQTLDYIGVYLLQPVFSHGQLYVALSRAKMRQCIKILNIMPSIDELDYTLTKNVVFHELLSLVNSSNR
ncbi:hypothetical protein FEM48_Zijuj12G0148300 [Ziziphus jujuba var. spinosa]|uniref:ATP-dependent DNA helicase n=1 Tax=Ziziphus jujuba var. spinosa TaxID=714518 RepID=A0A978UDZ1_ZIZJJ|nr:hypothetical protein FEM48_Zijuj12G0148300 [Ziziphus jujuba var. spinosa]